MTIRKASLPLALVLAAALSAAPVDAQKGNGNGNGNGNGKNKHEQRDRDDDRRRDDDDRRVTRRGSNDDVRWESRRGDDRWTLSRDRRSLTRNGRRVPPGWCQGRGNPHNTVANCGGYRYNTSRSLWDWIGLGSDTRRTTSRGTTLDRVLGGTRRTSSSGSYTSSHSEFHRVHDARCREAARTTSSLTRRLEIASACKDEHEDWHRRTGTRH
ncbi:MAG TPA: hypothetical protein VFR81_16285 [Longimicrobium sp.]|nr:hypothetical protein [Longimicrobium sp.]